MRHTPLPPPRKRSSLSCVLSLLDAWMAAARNSFCDCATAQWALNWWHGPGEVRTGAGVRCPACRQNISAGRRRRDVSESFWPESYGQSPRRPVPAAVFVSTKQSTGPPHHPGCGTAGKELAGRPSPTVFERHLAAGYRCLLRPRRVHNGNRRVASTRRPSRHGWLAFPRQALRLHCRVRTVHLFHGEQLRARVAQIEERQVD